MSSPKTRFLENRTVDEFDSIDQIIEVVKNYSPGPTGSKVHSSNNIIRLLRGGLGCVRESTRIATDQGHIPAGDISSPRRYLTFGEGQFRFSLGTAPFPKGKENLYRVVHTQGEFVAAAHHLILCADGNYRQLASLSSGDNLYPLDYRSSTVASSFQPRSNSEHYRRSSPSSDRRLIEKLLCFWGDCESLFRLCGQQPLSSLAFSQALPLQQGDARVFVREFDSFYKKLLELREEQQAKHNHLDQLFFHSQHLGSFRRMGALASVSVDRILQTVFEHILEGSQQFSQSPLRYEPHRKEKSIFPNHTFDPLKQSYSNAAILSIERIPFSEWYWDLQVPGDNNYVAEGAIHHNSGKTRCGTEHIDEICRTYPGAMCLIARKDITSLKVTTQKEFLEKVVIPETIETFNINENNLYYKNGSMVIFRETKDPDKVLSLELSAWLLDEANENDSREIVDKLRWRLRQKINIDGVNIAPPYAGLLSFNPTSKTHWLHDLAQEDGVDDFQFNTRENEHNLPEGYIENLEKALPPWEQKRLIDGEWGIEVVGKPVLWGFTEADNVRKLIPRRDLPLLGGWDFGYNHPCFKLVQFDPLVGSRGRIMIHRELLGHNEKLNEFTPRVLSIIKRDFDGWPVVHFGDPHGSDNKDVGESSIEYLRRHHGIIVNHKRKRIRVGIEDIQALITDRAIFDPESDKLESCFLVDPMCPITIAAYCYGYHKDEFGNPVKDGYFDHPVDTDRYILVGVRDQALSLRRKPTPYRPRNRWTGY